RLAVLIALRLDAELVDLDVPALGLGREPAEQGAAVFEDGAHRGAVADPGLDRLEPALDAAVQRVVVQALVVRLVRAALDRALLAGAPDTEAAPAEAAERGAHVGRLDEGIARAGDAVADACGVLQSGTDFTHVNTLSSATPCVG